MNVASLQVEVEEQTQSSTSSHNPNLIISISISLPPHAKDATLLSQENVPMSLEDQLEEREVLASIFPDEITDLSKTSFRVSIALDIPSQALTNGDGLSEDDDRGARKCFIRLITIHLHISIGRKPANSSQKS